MKIAIFIILYVVGVILTGTYFYKRHKTESLVKSVDEVDLLFIVIISMVFPITYLLGLLMIIIKMIGEKQCKDQ